MSLLYLKSVGTSEVSYVYQTDGTRLASFVLPPGAVGGVSAYALKCQVGAPDGTVYVGAINLAGQALLLQVQPETGALIRTITLTGIATLLDGYTLQILPNGHFLVVCTSASTVLKEFDDTGAVITSYSIPAGTCGCIGLASDGITLFYRVLGTSIVLSWNLSTDTAGPAFGDLGVTFQGQFVVLPDNRLLGLYLTSQPLLKLINADGSVSVVYTPTNSTNGTTGGMAYDVSTNRVYMSCSNNGDASGKLTAFNAGTGAIIWASTVTLTDVNLVGRVVLTPPNGSPIPYPVGDTVQEQIYRDRIGPWLSKNQVRLFFQRFQLDMQTGALPQDGLTPKICLRWTDDGQTWSPAEWVDYGNVGEFLFRVQQYQMGQARQRAYRVTMTSGVPVMWLRAFVTVEEGTS